MIPVQGSALESGKGKLSFIANMGKKQDAVEKSIPVNSGHLLWNELRTGKIEGEATAAYTFPDSVKVSNSSKDEYVVGSSSDNFRVATGRDQVDQAAGWIYGNVRACYPDRC